MTKRMMQSTSTLMHAYKATVKAIAHDWMIMLGYTPEQAQAMGAEKGPYVRSPSWTYATRLIDFTLSHEAFDTLARAHGRAALNAEWARKIAEGVSPDDEADLRLRARQRARELVGAEVREEVTRGLIRSLEEPGSLLCDCDSLGPPTNTKGLPIDHHCECRAVLATAKLLGRYSATVHAVQCGHGTELDRL